MTGIPITAKLPYNAINRVIVIGCGGIGSHLIGMLARELYFRKYIMDKHGESRGIKILRGLLLIDGDTVEEKNLFRQDFSPKDMNLPKAEAIARKYRDILDKVNIPVESDSIWIDDGCKDYFRHYDVILSCVDNNATRKILNDAIDPMRGGTGRCSLISGGNRGTLATVHVALYHNNRCLTAPIEHNQAEITNPDDEHPKDVSCMDETSFLKDPQVFRANLQAATLMFNAFINILEGRDFDYCQIWNDVGDMSYRKEPIPEQGKLNIANA